jgi:hypothetical protein
VGAGHRHGHRERQLMGTFGPVTVRVPRARLETSDSKTVEWKNATIPAYQRRTKHHPHRGGASGLGRRVSRLPGAGGHGVIQLFDLAAMSISSAAGCAVRSP